MNATLPVTALLWTALLWTARVWSLASIAFVAAFLVGNWPPPLEPRLLLFPIGVVAGLILAWRYELLGGGIALASLAAFYLSELAIAGVFPGGPWFLLVTAPALLFVVHALLERRGSCARAG